jgi:hypothetical protein
MRWMSLGVGISLLIGAVVVLIFKSTSLMSIEKNVSVDVYFSNSACSYAIEFSEELKNDPRNFLLISNCVQSKSFRDSSIVWGFEHLLPSFVYQQSSGGIGIFLQQWLQQPIGRIEQISPERFEGTSFLTHVDERKQIESIHFLCAYPELLAQYPKSEPSSSWEKNQYALLNECLGSKSYPHQRQIPPVYIQESSGEGVLELFTEGQSPHAGKHFDDWVHSTIPSTQK